jgi:hypothetical protein
MKKLIFSLLFTTIFIISSAQTKSEHLSFKGVPIDGALNEYVANMKQAGFSHMGTEDGIALLSGEFAGYRDCIIGVKTLKKHNLVHEIVVLFPTQDTWTGLNYDYNKLKSMLSKKYGEPEESVEKFVNTPIYKNINDDNHKLDEVKDNHCKYYSVFKVEKGSIALSIENDGLLVGCRVKLWYSDKLNSEAFEDAAMDDL